MKLIGFFALLNLLIFSSSAQQYCATTKKVLPLDIEKLKEIADTVVHLDTADSSTLKQFFKWVSDTIEQGNKSVGTTASISMPPPPSEVHLVI